MSVKKDFKAEVADRFLAEGPGDIVKILPEMTTKPGLDEDEYLRLSIRHSAGRQITIAGKGKRRYEFTGLISIQIFVPPNEGPERGDELADIMESMWRGRSIAGFQSLRFTGVHTRETGKDETGRYNVLLTEATFVYRAIM